MIIINETCIQCKLEDCLEVCPVDCFYEIANVLIISEKECIECSLCIPACPINAIEEVFLKTKERNTLKTKKVFFLTKNIFKKNKKRLLYNNWLYLNYKKKYLIVKK